MKLISGEYIAFVPLLTKIYNFRPEKLESAYQSSSFVDQVCFNFLISPTQLRFVFMLLHHNTTLLHLLSLIRSESKTSLKWTLQYLPPKLQFMLVGRSGICSSLRRSENYCKSSGITFKQCFRSQGTKMY